jgi:hypothetical protein
VEEREQQNSITVSIHDILTEIALIEATDLGHNAGIRTVVDELMRICPSRHYPTSKSPSATFQLKNIHRSQFRPTATHIRATQIWVDAGLMKVKLSF